MAMKTEVRYINAYVSGTCVPQPEKMPQKKSSARLPKAKKVNCYKRWRRLHRVCTQTATDIYRMQKNLTVDKQFSDGY